MHIFITYFVTLLVSSSLLAFLVEDDFLIKEEAFFIPGDVLAIEHSPQLELYCRIARENLPSAWEPFNKQDLSFTWVQFALKLDNTTFDSFKIHLKTLWQNYYALKIQSRDRWKAQLPKEGLKWDIRKKQFALHHSDTNTDDTIKTLQVIQQHHITKKQWPDIGYHFLISRDGLCYEGRPLYHKGSHVKNCNEGNIGICFIGCFEESEKNKAEPTNDMLETASELIAMLAIHFGIHLDDNSVKAHQDFKEAQTKCPGSFIMCRKDDIISWALDKEYEMLRRL